MRFLLFLLPVALFSADFRTDWVIKQVEKCEIYEILPTGSMKPGLDESYWALVQQTKWEDLKVGDIIVYESKDGLLICHAIWARSSGGSVVLCRGWANRVADEEMVVKSAYRGHVIGQIKRPTLPIEPEVKPVRFVIDKMSKVGKD